MSQVYNPELMTHQAWLEAPYDEAARWQEGYDIMREQWISMTVGRNAQYRKVFIRQVAEALTASLREGYGMGYVDGFPWQEHTEAMVAILTPMSDELLADTAEGIEVVEPFRHWAQEQGFTV